VYPDELEAMASGSLRSGRQRGWRGPVTGELEAMSWYLVAEV
jgi:hypothetical protein